jgi:hypothetical protein
VHVIPNGIDFRDLPEPARREIPVLIAGAKNPTFARAVAGRLAAAGIEADCLLEPLPRPAFLERLARARVALTLPLAREGFFLPALEAMAVGAVVVCPDCIGNRSFCRDGETAFRPSYGLDDVVAATIGSARMSDTEAAAMQAAAAEEVQKHGLQRERSAFLRILDAVGSFFASQRASLLASGTAVSKARGGRVPDNPFASTVTATGLWASTVENQDVRFDKRLRPGFRLVVKHPNMFTATLAALRTRFPCYAIVRNPLAALLSWYSIQAPIHDGHVPFGEAFDAELRSSLAAVLQSRNTSTLYDHVLVRRLTERLLAEPAVYDGFYEPADIEALPASWAVGAS